MINIVQHKFASGIVALVAVLVCWTSFTQEPAEAFLFPRVISVFFLVLALWTFGKALLGRSKAGAGITQQEAINLLPGLVISGVYVFWAANFLGFYTATAIAFLILLVVYDPAPHNETQNWVKRIAITVGFIAVLYGLFALLLTVYTPRGLFI